MSRYSKGSKSIRTLIQVRFTGWAWVTLLKATGRAETAYKKAYKARYGAPSLLEAAFTGPAPIEPAKPQ